MELGVFGADKPLCLLDSEVVDICGNWKPCLRREIERCFTADELENLFFGLGRGALNYRFEDGKPVIWKDRLPEKDALLIIHKVCFEIHQRLLGEYGMRTDIVFSRSNYCKIDLMVDSDRGGQLFLQEGEIDKLKQLLKAHGIDDGTKTLLRISGEISAAHGIKLSATCDAKYLEVGPTDKSDNVNDILDLLKQERGIVQEDCAFWGDEYIGADDGLFGSDSFMITEKSKHGDFFDVSDTSGKRPKPVKVLGGGVDTFIKFLKTQHE